MLFRDFQQAMSKFGIFSINDIKKAFPTFDSRRLNEWQNKKYIIKLINSWYCFNELSINEATLFQISNSLRSPSYISLETALSYYNIIPEQPFAITAITTIKTKAYNTPKGVFSYKKILPKLYFGYKVLPQLNGRPILMAEIEKALLDLLYLGSNLNGVEVIKAMRFNTFELKKIDTEKISVYLRLFNNKALENRYNLFKKLF